MKTNILALFFLIFGILVTGCSRETSSPGSPDVFLDDFLRLTPADGQTSVPLNAPVVLTFAKPVDRVAVERGLFLISEDAMSDSLCPVSQTMGHGSMVAAMADSSKMHHLDRYHSMRGNFTWNEDATQCAFRPDSLLRPRTRYMIHMNREMTLMMEQRMGMMDIMGAHGTGVMRNEMMFHFTTTDTQ
jgi:hypothetical protein